MKHFLYALLSGILLALAWPTYGFPLLLFFAFVPLLYTEHKIRIEQAHNRKWKILGLSYLSFFIWNLITTYWLYFSTPFGGIFAITVNSLLMSLVFLLFHVVAKRVNFKASSSFFISIWMAFEYLHLNWEFSWPWLNLGNGFSEFPHWIQWYEFTGTFGGTLWILLTNIVFLKMFLLYREHKAKEILYRGLVKTGLLILIPIAVSYFILWNYEESEQTLEAVVLQPNVNPYTEKYNTNDKRIGELLTRLAEESVTPQTSIVVAPETVFADGTILNRFEDSEANFFSTQFVNRHPEISFLSGISMYDRFSDPNRVRGQSNQLGPNDWYDDYNSAFMISANDSVHFYHKSKLVVGVENFPYQEVLKPILGNVMIDLGGTVAMKTTQKQRGTFQATSTEEVGPIICYESVYGDFVTGYVNEGADFLAIITNDAWWGNTQGHKQHLSYSRLRAIENRRSIARSANTGISAFINEKGEITASLGYEKQGALLGKVTLNDELTFYARFGDYIARISLFLALFIFLFAMVPWKRSRK
ncbi:apolipoprotein N-acyltransferase [Salinimicrobium sediminilitoris]|uniref:apolipoprotein N-acyltransferase n=1 Tax=Salinimicrobium sediminilitoris TaxID=2876715 RepID=UPI001E41F54A|nr:apolipoprotein N-acyltransferase [Salinimicrobium sediminilitoris]MCC8358550.1 apolipoprotein N-acyltransferase [Salinimicrobium sediminilitoris]